MNTTIARFLRALVFIVTATFASAADLPKGFSVPPDFREFPQRRKYLDFDTSEFVFLAPGEKSTTRQKMEGHVWQMAFSLGTNAKADPAATLTQFAAGAEKDGWSLLRREGTLVARKITDAGDLWMSGSGPGGDFRLVLLQAAPSAHPLTLTEPTKEIEKLDDVRDFPFAAPFPGSKLLKTVHDAKPFEIFLPGTNQSSYVTPKATKWYSEPKGVSSYEFTSVYRKALEAAGWVVVRGFVGGDAVVVAHYGKNGRDIWLSTHSDGVQQSIAIADTGAETQESNLQKQLRTEGHVALYGIYFDTDIATPRPESEPTLQHLLELLTNDAALHLEVQGHTDTTGTVPHNEQLSAARAASVKQWLVDHGIAADRLTSKGYAATKPVADNKSPEGRAKNRRVEVAKP